MSKIYFYDSVTSTLDKIVELAKTENLNPWDSVLAKMQTKGRGQMRRKWKSLEGNIFGAVNLPLINSFATTAASVVTGAFFVLALNEMGFDVKLKWPNDLVYKVHESINYFSGNLNDPSSFSCETRDIKSWVKVGGILLEEKTLQGIDPRQNRNENKRDSSGETIPDKILVAGVGINLICSPAIKSPTTDFTLEPGKLYQKNSPDNLSPQVFWEQLMGIIQDLPEKFFKSSWLEFINKHLLWKDEKITFQIESKDKTTDNGFEAIIRGVNVDGALLLETDQKTVPFFCGQIIKSPFWT